MFNQWFLIASHFHNAQEMKFFIRDFFSKCDQTAVWSHLLKKSLEVQLCKLKKHWYMIAYVFQKYPKNFTFQLFIIL